VSCHIDTINPITNKPYGTTATISVTNDKYGLYAGGSIKFSINARNSTSFVSMRIVDEVAKSTVLLKDTTFSTKLLKYNFGYTTGIPGSHNIKITLKDSSKKEFIENKSIYCSGHEILPNVELILDKTRYPLHSGMSLGIKAVDYETVVNIKLVKINKQEGTTMFFDSACQTTNIDITKIIKAPSNTEISSWIKLIITDRMGREFADSVYCLEYKALVYIRKTFEMEKPIFVKYINARSLELYNPSNASDVSGNIDIGLDLDSTYKLKISSPTFLKTKYGLNWQTYNQTWFKTLKDMRLYNPIVSGPELEEAFETDQSQAVETMPIMGGDTIIFKTADNRFGILHLGALGSPVYIYLIAQP
jgi:hypothetical protein